MRTILLVLISRLCCQGAIYSPDRANTQIDEVSRHATDSLTNQMTMALWVKQDGSGVNFGGGMLSKATPSQKQYVLRNGTVGLIDFLSDNHAGSDTLWRSSTGLFTDTNAFQFIALTFTFTDTNSLKIYLNDALVAGSWISTPTNAAGVSNNFPLSVGGTGNAGRLTGYYSEVAMWSGILSKAQLTQLCKSHVKGLCKQMQPSNLRVYLGLDSAPDSQSIGVNTVFPDQGERGAYAAFPGGGSSNPRGMAERVLSYPPNE